MGQGMKKPSDLVRKSQENNLAHLGRTDPLRRDISNAKHNAQVYDSASMPTSGAYNKMRERDDAAITESARRRFVQSEKE